MSQQTRTCCDICGATPDGNLCDNTRHYTPCGHDVCSNHDRDRKGRGLCAVCGVGRDGYSR